MFPKEWGVTHGTDMAIWYFGNGIGGKGLKDQEKDLVKEFAQPFWKFLRGDMQAEDWGTKGPLEVRRLGPSGKVEISKDQDWERGVGIYDTVRKAQQMESTSPSAKL